MRLVRLLCLSPPFASNGCLERWEKGEEGGLWLSLSRPTSPEHSDILWPNINSWAPEHLHAKRQMQTQTVVLLASIYLPSESLRHSQREKKERSLNLRVGRIVVMVERCKGRGWMYWRRGGTQTFFFGAEVDNRKRPPNKGRQATSAGDLTEG